ncbi:AAA family ATPase [Desulfotomaculum copahuensis]|uniref:NrS-1 polymerase-like HBD domain-containing protein n=1 Tax=Desulfotomaculum copahuensis TaxID=1838280 RepID=A0A1B7LAG2_9FIRM|nr:AAA family ATPase [Desulfotomaculum copahuensis]OAT79319.1 hypothetical protein A6M21_16285 [Desulfotomaculum copahuensis]
MRTENIPQELKDVSQWVVWRAERKGNGKIDKIPYNWISGSKASTVNPADWMTFEHAVKGYNKGYDGIGFVLTKDDAFVGIDLDNCIMDGVISDKALRIISDINSYTEISPSGKGIRIFTRAKLNGKGNRTGDYEIYSRERFLTLTGDKVDNSPSSVLERQAEVDAFHKRYIDKAEPVAQNDCGNELEDFEIIGMMSKKAKDLWGGVDFKEYNYPSQSEADLALMCELAFYTNRDPDKMEKLFRLSAYGQRDKNQRQDIIERLITKALGCVKEGPTKESKIVDLTSILTRPDVNKPTKDPDWVIPDISAKGDVTVCIGKQKGGKSWLWLRAACELSKGGKFMGGLANVRPQKVLYLMYDNVGEDRTMARIRKARWEFNPDNLTFVFNENVMKKEINIFLDQKDSYFDSVINSIKPDLLIVDTLGSCHTVNENSNEEMKPIITKFTRLARESNIAVVILHHTRKAKPGEASVSMDMDDSVGATIILRLASCIIGVKKQKTDAGEEVHKVMPLGSWYKDFKTFEYSLTDKEDDNGTYVDMAVNLEATNRVLSTQDIVENAIKEHYGVDDQFQAKDIVGLTGLNKNTVRKHLDALVSDFKLKRTGHTRDKIYQVPNPVKDIFLECLN